uniref:Protein rolling stone-like n=1 Tax=Drosophila rhopaloa TaxID=1041015 RepID=A0A6P4FBM6_DRORH
MLLLDFLACYAILDSADDIGFELSYVTRSSNQKFLARVIKSQISNEAFVLSEIHKIDALNIMVHVLNTIIMLIDLAIVGHPIKMSHAYFTTGIGLAYAIFTGIYFLAGGTDRKNQTAIYPMMDWTKPGKAIIVTACAIIFTFFVHFCCYLLYRGRVWLFTKLCIRGRHNRDGEM